LFQKVIKMKIFILLALVAAASAGPTTVMIKDGVATYNMKLQMVSDTSIYERAWDDFVPTILNGTNAQPGQFPQVARVSIVRSTGSGTCSGSLIATNFALTASHCVNSNPHLITSIGMLVGTVNRNVPGTTLQMAEFWWMQQPATLVRDIALIRSTVHFTPGLLINTVPIPRRAQTNYAFTGQEVTLIGWGVDNTGSTAMHLQWATFLAVPFSQCTANFREPYEICYIDPERWRMSQGGDSGAPVIVWENGAQLQVGIHAGRRTSGGVTFHSAARVSAFLDWVEELSGIRIRD